MCEERDVPGHKPDVARTRKRKKEKGQEGGSDHVWTESSQQEEHVKLVTGLGSVQKTSPLPLDACSGSSLKAQDVNVVSTVYSSVARAQLLGRCVPGGRRGRQIFPPPNRPPTGDAVHLHRCSPNHTVGADD
ncbi:hypothetical protein EYF80_004984 [Liparis tanakae]|uniref:Uncharacterized protein n=1 Tax=Liparis tanakae TaxID=230148 RepID=A0A4Z2J3Z0_9TELE|nr:hypothetical protein EYF80_004984 [Liparis tanakae]